MPGKRHGRQSKLSAARLVLEGEIPVKGLSDQLDVPCRALRRWAAEYGGDGEDAFPGSGNPVVSKGCERLKLKKENEELRKEAAILKNPGLLEASPSVGFEFARTGGHGMSVKKACGALGVSRELENRGFVQSFSRKGCPCDNAVTESFFKTLKRELPLDRKYDTRIEARQEIFKFIEPHRNTRRPHSSLGNLSPVEYERQCAH